MVDGLIPFLLNEFLFHQNARAMMEDKQMVVYPFFKKIGAFSVDRENKRKAVTSLRYASESMKRENSSLFIFPQGKIIPEYSHSITFENGIGWLHQHCPDCLFVPITITMHTMRTEKPELFINIGKHVDLPDDLDAQPRTKELEQILTNELNGLRITSSIDNTEDHFKIFV